MYELNDTLKHMLQSWDAFLYASCCCCSTKSKKGLLFSHFEWLYCFILLSRTVLIIPLVSGLAGVQILIETDFNLTVDTFVGSPLEAKKQEMNRFCSHSLLAPKNWPYWNTNEAQFETAAYSLSKLRPCCSYSFSKYKGRWSPPVSSLAFKICFNGGRTLRCFLRNPNNVKIIVSLNNTFIPWNIM